MDSRDIDSMLVRRTDPILTSPSHPVDSFDAELSRIIASMHKVMHQFNGVGLAAVQIGVPLRLFVVDSGRFQSTFVNPEILSYGPWYSTSEGCLSIPGESFHPPRPYSLHLAWLDPEGVEHQQRFDALEAHIISHEMDHLSGILAPDRCAMGPDQLRTR